jgi:holo-[acyl-carrier protein] synthase
MISGIGIDSIEIARVAKACQRQGSRFAEKLFTKLERERSARKTLAPYEHLAACFAAREAFFKATQVRYRRQEVSVAQKPSGEPYYVLSERAQREMGKRQVHLSLSHDQGRAIALCVCEQA